MILPRRYGVLQGQGAYHSSIRDMSKFLGAYLTLELSGTSQQHDDSNNGMGREKGKKPVSLNTHGGLPRTLAAAMHAATTPLGSDDFLPQHGQVASAWQIYRGMGSPVTWKSGASIGVASLWKFATLSSGKIHLPAYFLRMSACECKKNLMTAMDQVVQQVTVRLWLSTQALAGLQSHSARAAIA